MCPNVHLHDHFGPLVLLYLPEPTELIQSSSATTSTHLYQVPTSPTWLTSSSMDRSPNVVSAPISTCVAACRIILSFAFLHRCWAWRLAPVALGHTLPLWGTPAGAQLCSVPLCQLQILPKCHCGQAGLFSRTIALHRSSHGRRPQPFSGTCPHPGSSTLLLETCFSRLPRAPLPSLHSRPHPSTLIGHRVLHNTKIFDSKSSYLP